MAVLKDLIVHGRSRFINGAEFNTVKANTIDATNGYFKYLKAIEGDIEDLTVEELLAQNATVVGLLDVKGEMHTNSWTNANIANIGGSFYISPTLSSAATSVTISTYRDNETDYYSITVSGGTFATASSGITWSAGSKVMVTGSVTKDNVTYPLGTCTGNLSGIDGQGFTVNQIAQTGEVSDIPGDSTTNGSLAELVNTFGSGTIFTSTKITISMYEIGPSSAYKPVGILLTSYGLNKETYIDIYGGVNIKNTDLTDDIPDGFTDPNVRIGYLGGIPAYTDSNGISHKPTGWGIYTDNGYFQGVVVADSGLIGGFTIADDLHKGGGIGTQNSVYVSTGTQAEPSEHIGESDGGLNWAFTAGSNFGVTTDGTLYATGAKISGKVEITNDSNVYTKEEVDFVNNQIDTIVGAAAWIGEYGTYKLTTDTTIVPEKLYFTLTGTAVENPTGNPSQLKYYEQTNNVFVLSTDTNVDSQKTYYTVIGTPTVPTIEDLQSSYELNTIDSTVSNFLTSHVIIDESGLKVTFDETQKSYLLLTGDSVTIYRDGQPVSTYGDKTILGDERGCHLEISGGTPGGDTPELGFYSGEGSDYKVAYINNNQLYIPQVVVVTSMQVGDEKEVGAWRWLLKESGTGAGTMGLYWIAGTGGSNNG